MSSRIRSGALMMSALVPASAHIVTGPLTAGDAAFALGPERRRRAAELRLQLGREILGVGVVQIPDKRVAALRRWRVEVRDQRRAS